MTCVSRALGFWAAALLCVGCGSTAPKIWHGEPTSLAQVVAIGERSGDTFTTTCSGVALAHDRVLTAGHCVSGCGSVSLWISDEDDVNRKAATRFWLATRAIRHPRYAAVGDGTFVNDLAVLEVPGALLVPWTGALGSRDREATRYKVGYGWTTVNEHVVRGTRLGGRVAPLPSENAQQSPFRFEYGRKVCSFDSGGGTFELDSTGQPIALTGVTAYASHMESMPGGVDCSTRGVDMAVGAYVDWILFTLRGDCPCGAC